MEKVPAPMKTLTQHMWNCQLYAWLVNKKKGLLLSEITVGCGEKKRANQTRTCLDLDTVSTVHLCCHGKQTFPV